MIPTLKILIFETQGNRFGQELSKYSNRAFDILNMKRDICGNM